MLSHTVTGDETWVFHITPESKQQCLHWKHTGSPKRKKLKQTFSTRKIMCTVFWDRHVLLIEFLPQGTTINSAVYCETLKKLRCAIQNKRRRMLSATTLLFHDNTRPHKCLYFSTRKFCWCPRGLNTTCHLFWKTPRKSFPCSLNFYFPYIL